MRVAAPQIGVQTGDVRGAGTDSDISIQLFGTKAQSQVSNAPAGSQSVKRSSSHCFNL